MRMFDMKRRRSISEEPFGNPVRKACGATARTVRFVTARGTHILSVGGASGELDVGNCFTHLWERGEWDGGGVGGGGVQRSAALSTVFFLAVCIGHGLQGDYRGHAVELKIMQATLHRHTARLDALEATCGLPSSSP